MSFSVPEAARWINAPGDLASSALDGNNGAFRFPSPEAGWELIVIASDGLGWEHVSVHARNRGRPRIPTWKEMAFIKTQFWSDDDPVFQIYPRRQDYVNQHPHVLHWWRPTTQDFPTPPPELVGALGVTVDL